MDNHNTNGFVFIIRFKKITGNIKNIGEGRGEYDKARELFRREMENATRIAEEPKSYLMGPKITARLVRTRETRAVDHLEVKPMNNCVC